MRKPLCSHILLIASCFFKYERFINARPGLQSTALRVCPSVRLCLSVLLCVSVNVPVRLCSMFLNICFRVVHVHVQRDFPFKQKRAWFACVGVAVMASLTCLIVAGNEIKLSPSSTTVFGLHTFNPQIEPIIRRSLTKQRFLA